MSMCRQPSYYYSIDMLMEKPPFFLKKNWFLKIVKTSLNIPSKLSLISTEICYKPK